MPRRRRIGIPSCSPPARRLLRWTRLRRSTAQGAGLPVCASPTLLLGPGGVERRRVPGATPRYRVGSEPDELVVPTAERPQVVDQHLLRTHAALNPDRATAASDLVLPQHPE